LDSGVKSVVNIIPNISASWLSNAPTQAIFQALNSQGFEARVVGGAVRNALLGRAVADIDIATTALPEQTTAAARAAGLTVIPTGIQHGTVTVLSAGIAHEVTTLRRDVTTDGRHAVVAFTDDWAADASRRDFTINALYCDAAGAVFDPLGGYPDLCARRVRFIGDPTARIHEDYLRILRFFRFTAEYSDGPVDAAGLAACSQSRDGLSRLSAERIRVEILKILGSVRAAEMASLLQDDGYWVPLLGLAPVPQHLARMVTLTDAGSDDAVTRLGALCITTTEDAERLAQRLRMSKAEHETLAAIGELSLRLATVSAPPNLRRLLYREGRARVRAALLTAWARQGTRATDPERQAELTLVKTWTIPVLPISGRDVLERGAAPGPAFSVLLSAIERLWIESDFKLDRAALLQRLDAHMTG
jgi:poly(A) polymerase